MLGGSHAASSSAIADRTYARATDGGLFSFGTAQYYGSTGAAPPPGPGTQMAATPSGAGYWLAFANGQVFAYGGAKFYGSAG